MWLLECRIVKEKEPNTALHGNATFARNITLEKRNLMTTLKFAQVFRAMFIILTH